MRLLRAGYAYDYAIPCRRHMKARVVTDTDDIVTITPDMLRYIADERTAQPRRHRQVCSRIYEYWLS